jgi:hypothetical protein
MQPDIRASCGILVRTNPDEAIWLAASRDAEKPTGKFWSKRHEIPCRFCDPARIATLVARSAQQVAVPRIQVRH